MVGKTLVRRAVKTGQLYFKEFEISTHFFQSFISKLENPGVIFYMHLL